MPQPARKYTARIKIWKDLFIRYEMNIGRLRVELDVGDGGDVDRSGDNSVRESRSVLRDKMSEVCRWEEEL